MSEKNLSKHLSNLKRQHMPIGHNRSSTHYLDINRDADKGTWREISVGENDNNNVHEGDTIAWLARNGQTYYGTITAVKKKQLFIEKLIFWDRNEVKISCPHKMNPFLI